MGTQFSVTVFALMWGVPYLTVAQGLSTARRGRAADALGGRRHRCRASSIGIFTGRYPHRRSWIVLAIIAQQRRWCGRWCWRCPVGRRCGCWSLLIVVISVGGPGSMVGFDFARTFNPSATLGTAQGMVNMGGFVASLLVMQAMGVIIGAAGGLLVRVVPAGVDGAVRDLGARRRRHPDHPAARPAG